MTTKESTELWYIVTFSLVWSNAFSPIGTPVEHWKAEMGLVIQLARIFVMSFRLRRRVCISNPLSCNTRETILIYKAVTLIKT